MLTAWSYWKDRKLLRPIRIDWNDAEEDMDVIEKVLRCSRQSQEAALKFVINVSSLDYEVMDNHCFRVSFDDEFEMKAWIQFYIDWFVQIPEEIDVSCIKLTRDVYRDANLFHVWADVMRNSHKCAAVSAKPDTRDIAQIIAGVARDE